MSCDRFELLSVYIDGETTADERTEMERHIFGCVSCRSDYRTLKAHRQTLRCDPPPLQLPLRLELALGVAAERFLRDGHSLEHPTASPLIPISGGHRTWRQLVVAAAIALFAVGGMGVSANRAGSIPTLSVVGKHIAGLSPMGHQALFAHVQHARDNDPPELLTHGEIRQTLRTVLPIDIAPPRADRMGRPLAARAIDLDGVPAVMLDYALDGLALTVFAVPRQEATERLDLDTGPTLPNACSMHELRQCFADDVGTSLCVRSVGDMVYIWVGFMPPQALDAIVDSASFGAHR